MNYYRFPEGAYEDLGPPFTVIKYRPMPSTPAGDEIAIFDTAAEADLAVDFLNSSGFSLKEAIEHFIKPKKESAYECECERMVKARSLLGRASGNLAQGDRARSLQVEITEFFSGK